MKKTLVGIFLTLGIALAVHAGTGPIVEGIVVTDNPDGSRTVEGSLVGVRFTDDDTQHIGCSVSSNTGAASRVICAARDLNEEIHFCFSFDPAMVETAKMMSPYSFITYTYDPDLPECLNLLASVRSFHIPDKDTGKTKGK